MDKIELTEQTRQFFTHLWRGGTAAYWWYVDEQSKDKTSHWFDTSDIAEVQPNETEHAYFGVHPTGEQRSEKQRSTIKTIAAINCIFAEFDGDVSLETIEAIEPCPSVIIESSPGKYHAYWLLDTPFIMEGAEQRSQAQRLQQAWVTMVKGDNGAKDLARVLRVPGTRNIKAKYAPDYHTVSFVRCDLDTVYSIDELAAIAQPHMEKPKEHNKPEQNGVAHDPYAERAYRDEIARLALATEHTRNDTLFKVSVRLDEFVQAGRLPEGVFQEVSRIAEQIGLDNKEIHATIASSRGRGTPETRGMDNSSAFQSQHVNPETGEVIEDDRPRIDVTDEDIAELVPAAWRALMSSEYASELYVMGSELYRVIDNKIKAVNRRHLRYLLGNVALFPKDVGTSKKPKIKNVAPPVWLLDGMPYGMPDTLPHIKRIVTMPVVTPQGHIIYKPGYDAASEYYSTTQLQVNVPECPGDEQVIAALDMVNDMLHDFPFAGEADRTNAIALLLLPLVRGAIPGSTPLHLIEAAREGTGKGLLNDAIHTVWTGLPAPLSSLADNDEEVRKSLTSALEYMPLSITYDNVRWINSAQLEKAVTAQQWSDRVLGTSRICDVPVHTVWIATGNNVAISGDMPRRVVPIRLVADCEQPALRTGFKHPNLLGWVRDHREKLIEACLTIIQYGLQSDIPGDVPILGSFDGYCTVMGKILASCNLEGFLTNAAKKINDDNDHINMWRDFFEAWHGLFGDADKTAREAYEALLAGEKPQTVLPLRGDDERAKIMSLGNLLKKQVDAVYTINEKQYRITKGEYVKKTYSYRVTVQGENGGAVGLVGLSQPFARACKKVKIHVKKPQAEIAPLAPLAPLAPPSPPSSEQWVAEHFSELCQVEKWERLDYIKAQRPGDYLQCQALFFDMLVQEGERTV